MSAQELADLESLHNDGVLDDDEYQTKLAELKPRSQADELADLKALLDEGILDADEYAEKRKEIEGPPPKKARTQKPPPAADDYEKLTVAKLKAKSKERGLAMSGDKGVLIWRLKLKDAHGDLQTKDGADPFSFRGAALKKAAARHGVNCMGSPEEMLEGSVTKLAKDAPSKPALDEDGSQDVRRAATRILELVAEDAWEDILSLGAPGKTLTSRSPLNDLRGAYRRLSRLVHPDKLRGFDGATRAFQALVTALDRVTNPEAPAVEDEAARGPAIERTNEGCRRTRVACPRCARRRPLIGPRGDGVGGPARRCRNSLPRARRRGALGRLQERGPARLRVQPADDGPARVHVLDVPVRVRLRQRDARLQEVRRALRLQPAGLPPGDQVRRVRRRVRVLVLPRVGAQHGHRRRRGAHGAREAGEVAAGQAAPGRRGAAARRRLI